MEEPFLFKNICIGCAQFIEWDPLRASPVQLPENAVFVIANSLAEANKAATSDFNQRVVECRLACRFLSTNWFNRTTFNTNNCFESILAKQNGLNWKNVNRFAFLQKELQCSLETMEQLVKRGLEKKIYFRSDIADALDINEASIESHFLSNNTKHLQEFKLRQRALHVCQGNSETQQI